MVSSPTSLKRTVSCLIGITSGYENLGQTGSTIINGTIFVDEHNEPVIAQAILFSRSLKHLNDYENEFGTFNKISKQFKTKLYESLNTCIILASIFNGKEF